MQLSEMICIISNFINFMLQCFSTRVPRNSEVNPKYPENDTNSTFGFHQMIIMLQGFRDMKKVENIGF